MPITLPGHLAKSFPRILGSVLFCTDRHVKGELRNLIFFFFPPLKKKLYKDSWHLWFCNLVWCSSRAEITLLAADIVNLPQWHEWIARSVCKPLTFKKKSPSAEMIMTQMNFKNKQTLTTIFLNWSFVFLI